QTFHGMIERKLVDESADQFHAFEVVERLQVVPSEQFEVFLHDGIAKRMKRINIHAMRFAADEFLQPLAHGKHTRNHKRQATDAATLCIRFLQYLSDADSKDVGHSGSRPGDNQHGAFDLVDGFLLLRVEHLKRLLKSFIVLLKSLCGIGGGHMEDG